MLRSKFQSSELCLIWGHFNFSKDLKRIDLTNGVGEKTCSKDATFKKFIVLKIHLFCVLYIWWNGSYTDLWKQKTSKNHKYIYIFLQNDRFTKYTYCTFNLSCTHLKQTNQKLWTGEIKHTAELWWVISLCLVFKYYSLHIPLMAFLSNSLLWNGLLKKWSPFIRGKKKMITALGWKEDRSRAC